MRVFAKEHITIPENQENKEKQQARIDNTRAVDVYAITDALYEIIYANPGGSFPKDVMKEYIGKGYTREDYYLAIMVLQRQKKITYVVD